MCENISGSTKQVIKLTKCLVSICQQNIDSDAVFWLVFSTKSKTDFILEDDDPSGRPMSKIDTNIERVRKAIYGDHLQISRIFQML